MDFEFSPEQMQSREAILDPCSRSDGRCRLRKAQTKRNSAARA